MRIAVLAGYFSTNIGNSFFQLGAEYALRQALPTPTSPSSAISPATGTSRRATTLTRSTRRLSTSTPRRPQAVFRPEIEGILGKALRAQRAKGCKICVLAAGMMQYDQPTVDRCKRLLDEIQPFVFTTRDRETYELLGGSAQHAFDGVDVATFVSDLHKPFPTDLPPYLVLNFDQIPEPRFERAQPGAQADKHTRVFQWEGETWAAHQPSFRTEMAYRSRAFLFAEALLPGRRAAPTTLRDLRILRTDHRYNPFLPRRSYQRPDTYAGDIPQTYLNMYAHTRATFSNRVHACVATVSYGHPAMLFTRSPRARLLSRLGLDDITKRPVALDTAWLAQEKAKLIGFLRTTLGAEAR